MTEIADDELTDEFAPLGLLLRQLADRGHGTVLGLVPTGRGGIRRVSRALAAEFERRLVETYRLKTPTLVRLAARKVGDHSRAEDVVQRAFEKILRRQQKDQPEISNLDAYLVTAVCNEVNRELRSVIPERDNAVTDSDGDQPDLPSGRPDVSSQVADALAVRAALAELPPREREAVVIRMQWQLSVAEAADVMQLSPGAVKRYTADGLRRLRERLTAA
ncbi:RNA polymerase sigma factor [Pseudonocardia spinosispora]|uniref:RNA polymerase sigma factor n=1 Tax=Pseudonocardia spinosispora TaxID=103441 RepID=UPI00042A108F|nr:sigma-70 family RNA polymerase sigma factor [Pseudonocardia spinosispora]